MIQKLGATQAVRQRDDGAFRFTVSTGATDRDGDTVDPAGWDLSEFKLNPVVLWCHDPTQPPIGRARDIRIVEGGLVADIEFPPEGLYPLADTVRGLVREGFITSTSVGFRPLEAKPNSTRGYDYKRQRLQEISLVPIPANPQATLHGKVPTTTGPLGAALIRRGVLKHGWSPTRAATVEMLPRARAKGIDATPLETWLLGAEQSARPMDVQRWLRASPKQEALMLPVSMADVRQMVYAAVESAAQTPPPPRTPERPGRDHEAPLSLTGADYIP